MAVPDMVSYMIVWIRKKISEAENSFGYSDDVIHIRANIDDVI